MILGLKQLYEQERINALDMHFGDYIERMAHKSGAESGDIIGLTAALISRERSRGNSCLHLDQVTEPFGLDSEDRAEGIDIKPGIANPTEINPFPPFPEWRDILRAAPLLVSDGSTPTPLVLDESNRLYLYRYYSAERRIATHIANLAVPFGSGSDQPDIGLLEKLFPNLKDGSIDWQKVAALSAWRHRLCVITGGAGTGKTTTVMKILLLLGVNLKHLRIGMAAPTGKAAMRLQQEIHQGMQRLQLSEQDMPIEVRTVHRLLGYNGTKHEFRYHCQHRLPFDLIILDEASMLDLLLFDALLAAMPDNSRLILLGDRNQLPSVETGSAFFDICHAASMDLEYSQSFSQYCNQILGHRPVVAASGDSVRRRPSRLGDSVIELKKAYRFETGSDIFELAEAILMGNSEQVLSILNDPKKPNVRQLGCAEALNELARIADSPASMSDSDRTCPDVRKGNKIDLKGVLDSYLPIIQMAETAGNGISPVESMLEKAFGLFGRTRILCATRKGEMGLNRTTRRIEQGLMNSLGRSLDKEVYPGCPIMITANNYPLQLFNGDIGLCWPDEASNIAVYFEAASGQMGTSYRRFPLNRLSEHQTAWAMTIHKAQGSQFEHVILFLPSEPIPILSRELLYTGITRARHSVWVVAENDIIRSAMNTQNKRWSGLSDAISNALGRPKIG